MRGKERKISYLLKTKIADQYFDSSGLYSCVFVKF